MVFVFGFTGMGLCCFAFGYKTNLAFLVSPLSCAATSLLCVDGLVAAVLLRISAAVFLRVLVCIFSL